MSRLWTQQDECTYTYVSDKQEKYYWIQWNKRSCWRTCACKCGGRVIVSMHESWTCVSVALDVSLRRSAITCDVNQVERRLFWFFCKWVHACLGARVHGHNTKTKLVHVYLGPIVHDHNTREIHNPNASQAHTIVTWKITHMKWSSLIST
jgi:hypothetical protein